MGLSFPQCTSWVDNTAAKEQRNKKYRLSQVKQYELCHKPPFYALTDNSLSSTTTLECNTHLWKNTEFSPPGACI